MSFDSFSFDRTIVSGINDAGYKTPTPIQSQAIDPVLKGRDVMGLAQTGTGKTAAFALPILQRLVDSKAEKTGPMRVLVLAPTRELALQIHENFITLGKQTGLRSAAVFGGVGVTPQIKAQSKATIVVACPGRLLDLMNRGVADLSNVQTLVLDEADRMLDMGFLPDIKRILAKLPRERQNLLFSATMPKEIRQLSKSILNDPAIVQVDNIAPAESVSHSFYPVPAHLKASFLIDMLQTIDYQSVLVFTRTKHKAKALAHKLERKGMSATFLQGNLSQNRRQKALDGFRNGDYRIMIATDIAARGIDCEKISHVINYDVPDTVENYTHRIGRTGRAGMTGKALSYITPDDSLFVRDLERFMGANIERKELEGFDYDKQPSAQQREQFRRNAKRPAKGRGMRPAKTRSGNSRPKAGKSALKDNEKRSAGGARSENSSPESRRSENRGSEDGRFEKGKRRPFSPGRRRRRRPPRSAKP